MKTALGFLAVATFLVAPSLSTAQSSEQPDGQAIAYGIQASADEISPEVQLYIGRGDELWDPLESTCRHASLSIL